MAWNHVKGVVTWPDLSGDPRNDTVNVWHVRVDDTSLIGNTNIWHGYVNNFYNSLSQYFSRHINRSAGQAQYFRMEDPRPRRAYLEVPMSMSALTDPNAYNAPNELSVAISYGARVNSGDRRARKSGRLYLGPLVYYVTLPRDLSYIPDQVQDTVVASLDDLLVSSFNNALVDWCIYSPYTHAGFAVGSGPPPGEPFPELPANLASSFGVVSWARVDNAWDIQRRRGLEYTRRVWCPSGDQSQRSVLAPLPAA